MRTLQQEIITELKVQPTIDPELRSDARSIL